MKYHFFFPNKICRFLRQSGPESITDGRKKIVSLLTVILIFLGLRFRADGKELPEDMRQKTDLQLGVLTVLSVQKGIDSGSYTCVANNKHGHSAKRTTTVDVIGKVFRRRVGWSVGRRVDSTGSDWATPGP